ncbi:MAG: FecR family protein [Nitrospira sp.]|nr:FecR family protein [Nitrospira sp.]
MRPCEEEARLRKEAVAWVVRLQNDSLSPEERRAFNGWYEQSPAHALMFRKVLTVWDSPDLRAAAEAAVQADPSSFKIRTTVRRWWPIPVAACIILVIVVAVHLDVMTRWRADYRTEVGERRTVELPDRSIVTLNTQSAIELSFDASTRRIRLLKGEALFNVRHDPAHPFIVESADTATRAVGTAFVVRAEPAGDQVIVIEGAVEVDAISSRRETHLPAIATSGSRIDMVQGRMGEPYPVDISAASAWARGRLVVNGVPFAQVIDELRRYYPGTIVLWNHTIDEMRVTGTYNLDDPARVLSLLTQTLPIRQVSWTDRIVILF